MALREQAIAAKRASVETAALSIPEKNRVLEAMGRALLIRQGEILEANAMDVATGRERLSPALIDRLTLTKARIEAMAQGFMDVAGLPDPIGQIISMEKRPNGLVIGQKRVPLGLVGVIYEARPNVTADVASLCVKTGNACLLKGGKEAFRSNLAVVKILQDAAEETGYPRDAVQLVMDTSRETTREMMGLTGILDVLIPRGGAGLIRAVVENASVPVIETGVGICHTYVDEGADLAMAQRIAVNAKVSRPGVCNAMETLLVHRAVAGIFLPSCLEALKEKGVEIRGCAETQRIVPWVKPASKEDWDTEYLDLILSVKVVGGMDEAIAHIRDHGTGHSEAIITENYTRAQSFLERVDAAAVYVNASTRFTDGFEFGYGAEIGISTQKLHARGPMGLLALTSTKYIIYGTGQVRE